MNVIPFVLSVAPEVAVARFDSGRFAAYAQRERKLAGAESKDAPAGGQGAP